MSLSKHLLVRTSAFAILSIAAVPALAQGIGRGLQPEYVIVSADRGQNADPTRPDLEVTAAKAQEQINTVNT